MPDASLYLHTRRIPLQIFPVLYLKRGLVTRRRRPGERRRAEVRPGLGERRPVEALLGLGERRPVEARPGLGERRPVEAVLGRTVADPEDLLELIPRCGDVDLERCCDVPDLRGDADLERRKWAS
ncbi:hypothetical protein AVEN_112026-1 [Araneus ventricosus]|uniref:Uncharacterized protein n=1 Tax=Araneus ventricosus TaxID=182803 RepID=A0A4Y2QQY4_ARAVE|nr:hypothetical protein AVEN_112026-1 [Araneus ventricosus]